MIHMGIPREFLGNPVRGGTPLGGGNPVRGGGSPGTPREPTDSRIYRGNWMVAMLPSPPAQATVKNMLHGLLW